MRTLRAIVFNTLFYGWLVCRLLWLLVMLPLPRRVGFRSVQSFMRQELALQRLFGMTIEVRGLENLPKGGFIVAAKHQSMWETFALLPMFEDVAFIYKKELGRVPLFGWYMRKFAQVAIDRSAGSQALRLMNDEARKAIAENRQVLIFPEGTRRPVGAPPQYKFGVAAVYDGVKAPVVPIALNSGMFWSKYFWRGDVGRIIIDILPPIQPGMSRGKFFKLLEHTIETACDAQMLEIADGPNPPPLSDMARERINDLRRLRDEAAKQEATPPQQDPQP